MNTLLLCCMRQTCPLRSELLLLLLTSMYATCIQPHIFRRIPLHMSSGSSRSQMCHTFECGAALHMFMCKRTKEMPMAFTFRSVSLWDIPQRYTSECECQRHLFCPFAHEHMQGSPTLEGVTHLASA